MDRRVGHADEKISTALAPRRADDTGNSWSVPRWHDRGGLPVCGVSRQPTVQTASSDDGKTALAFFLNGTPNVAR
jgi:hypothetical protein